MSKRAVIIPVITLGVAAGLLFTIDGCWTSWEGGGADQRTDDAYVRADMTPLSTRISGTVRKMDVDDYQTVQPGQFRHLDGSQKSPGHRQLEKKPAAAKCHTTKLSSACNHMFTTAVIHKNCKSSSGSKQTTAQTFSSYSTTTALHRHRISTLQPNLPSFPRSSSSIGRGQEQFIQSHEQSLPHQHQQQFPASQM